MADSAADKKVSTGDNDPKVVVFLCNWAYYTDKDMGGEGVFDLAPGVKVVRMMCSGQLSPVYVLKALQQGADAVLVVGCHPEKCRYKHGNYHMKMKVTLLRELMEYIGIDPRRVQTCWSTPKEPDALEENIKRVIEDAKAMGPETKLRRV